MTSQSSMPTRTSRFAGAAIAFAFAALVGAGGLLAMMNLWSQPAPVELVPKDTAANETLNVLKAMPAEKRAALTATVEKQLRQNPLDLTQLLRLSALAAANGDQARSDALTLQAAGRSYQDIGLQASAFQIELKNEDFSAAIRRADVLLKTAPNLGPTVFKTLALLAQNPKSTPSLVAALAKRPDWRGDFFKSMTADQSVPVNAIYSLLTELRTSQSDETQDELHGMLQRLVDKNDYDKAYYFWVDSLNEIKLRKAGLIYDGGFDLPADNQFFSWNIYPVANAETRMIPRAPGSTDLVLRIDFAYGKTQYGHTHQTLRLQPGTYKFSAEAKAEDLKTSNGLYWRVYCISEASQQVGAGPRLKGSQQWNRFSFDLVVPENDCKQQRLQLQLDAPTALDSQVSGSVSYDGLTIEPITAEQNG